MKKIAVLCVAACVTVLSMGQLARADETPAADSSTTSSQNNGINPQIDIYRQIQSLPDNEYPTYNLDDFIF